MHNKFVSVEYFKYQIEETRNLIMCLRVESGTFDYSKLKNKQLIKAKKIVVSIDKYQQDKIFELGFIVLYANFEHFMFEIIKELCAKFPNALSDEKNVKYSEIQKFKSINEIKNYVNDKVAIEKSYDIDKWKNCLENQFKIVPFKNDSELQKIKILNYFRNIILHSGGTINSKFVSDMGTTFKDNSFKIGKKLNLDKEKAFNFLLKALEAISNNF